LISKKKKVEQNLKQNKKIQKINAVLSSDLSHNQKVKKIYKIQRSVDRKKKIKKIIIKKEKMYRKILTKKQKKNSMRFLKRLIVLLNIKLRFSQKK